MNSSSLRSLVVAWVALLVLLALSCGSAYVHLGIGNALANYGIAIAKAAIVVVLFMHIGRGTQMLRIAGAAGLVALLILTTLSATDFLVRPS